jgi:two-component sensor histidine kinase
MLDATAGPSATSRPSSPTNTLCPPALYFASPPVTARPSGVVGRLAASSERPDGVAAVLTVAALLADLNGHNTIDMDGWLDDLGRDLDATFGRTGGSSLSCNAAKCPVPMGQAITLGLITDLLVSNAYVHGFPPGDGGRIAVSLVELEAIFELTIDDSGRVNRGTAKGRTNGSTLARRLVRQVGGWLETPRVIGGRRYIITVPRHSLRLSS